MIKDLAKRNYVKTTFYRVTIKVTIYSKISEESRVQSRNFVWGGGGGGGGELRRGHSPRRRICLWGGGVPGVIPRKILNFSSPETQFKAIKGSFFLKHDVRNITFKALFFFA